MKINEKLVASRHFLALTAIASLFLVQIIQTLRNKNWWPFCSYNMFHYDTPKQFQELRVRLLDDEGNITPLLDTWGLLPLEFFRVVSILEQVYIVNTEDDVKRRFSQKLLKRLNERPWKAFDEIKPAIRSSSRRPFIGFELLLLDIDLDICDPFDRSSCIGEQAIYRFMSDPHAN